MRIIFMGTPDFAVPALEALMAVGDAAGHEVVAVYSQPPRPGGRRGRELTPSPVHRRAQDFGIEVRHPASLKGADEQAALAALGADLAVVAAYGLILPQPVLDAPKLGCLNIHASLLPRWRGAAPIQRAILAGDAKTGVCIMRMEAGLDTGPVLLERKWPIGLHDTAGMLTGALARVGASMIVEVLADLRAFPAMPQAREGVTYAKKIDKTEARLDFTAGATQVDRQIRAFAPTPGAWFEYAGERIKVLEGAIVTPTLPATPGEVLGDQLAIACGEGAIRPTLVQRAGRGVMDTLELLRGFPIPAGARLG